MPLESPPTPAARPNYLKQWGPWIVGIAILVIIGTRIPFAQFRASLGRGPHLQLIIVEILITILVLGTDSASTWVGLRAMQIKWPFRTVLAVRGATYLLFLLNYALGQTGFGYYLYKAGTTAMRSVGSTLFLIGTNLATLVLLTGAVWLVYGGHNAYPAMRWALIIITVGFALYLVIIALRPRFLSSRDLFAPLFDAGLGGHAVAIAGRVPHVIVVVLSYWVCMVVWGIDVPFVTAITVMPAVALAGVLPISPAGLGTTQAAMVYFFSSYAAGGTADERAANIFAFGLSYFVYGVGAAMLVGLVCLPLTKKITNPQ